MDDADVCESWEQMENPDLLEKRLEKLRLKGSKAKEPAATEPDSSGDGAGSARLNGGGPEPSFPQFRILSRNEAKLVMDTKKVSPSVTKIELDSTTQESLRTQYVAPEPKLKILSRPKEPKTSENGSARNKKAQVTKTLQQREQEYAEARMRILGDVRFHEEEQEAALEAAMSPAEILKLKISEAMQNEPGTTSTPPGSARSETSLTSGQSDSDSNSAAAPGSTSKSSKKKAAKIERVPNPAPLRDFPLSKVESDRIVRQPRGPDADGSTGFVLKR